MKYILVFIWICSSSLSFSQNLNWGSLKSDQKHIVHAYTGLDFGFVYGLGYSYQLKSKMPLLFNITYSFPSGKHFFDDFNTRIGAQCRLYSIKNFHISASFQGLYRRFQNPLVQLRNFGSDFSCNIGYYRKHGFIAAEAGFDKAIVTHFKHSDLYRTNVYNQVQDGWYEPATGGNFRYNIIAGGSWKHNDFYLKFGKVLTQDFKTAPTFPLNIQLGYNYRIFKRIE
jgi:hypothetical protein